RATAHRRAGISRISRARKDLDHADQGARQPARSCACLLPGRGVRVHRNPGESHRGGPLYGARQPRGGDHQRHRGAGAGQHRCARMKIPVFHDDQHGTAIVAAAAVLNGLKIVGKDIAKVKLTCSGAGAAALACLNLLVSLGLNRGNIFVTDSKGVVYKGRKEAMDPDKERYAQDTEARTLGEIIKGADIFLGLSAGGVLTAEMAKKMADKPIILAMANPEPEIRPEV